MVLTTRSNGWHGRLENFRIGPSLSNRIESERPIRISKLRRSLITNEGAVKNVHTMSTLATLAGNGDYNVKYTTVADFGDYVSATIVANVDRALRVHDVIDTSCRHSAPPRISQQ